MTATLIGLAGLIILLLIRVPLGFAMLIVGFLGTSTVRGMDAALMGVSTTIFEIAISPAFVVLPLFMLMGSLVSQARLSDDLYDTANAWMGHLKGGLAMSTVAASGGFAAVTGNSVATVVTMAKVALPSMRRYKYGDSLAAGTIAAGGTLGILIPPSNALIIYGLLTETSIGRLFIGGVIPAMIITLALLLTVRYVAKRRGYRPERERRLPVRQIATRARAALWALAMPILLIVGLRGGWFTPTELGAIAALYAFLVGMFIYRGFNLYETYDLLRESALTTANVLFIVASAAIFAWILISNQMAARLAGACATSRCESATRPSDPRLHAGLDHRDEDVLPLPRQRAG